VRTLIDAAHSAAERVLLDNREVLDRVARELIVHETLEAERVQELFADVRMWDTGDGADPRASMRPEGAPPAPSRNNAAAATQSDTKRRPGGSA
jgi:cell division protease FtsH